MVNREAQKNFKKGTALRQGDTIGVIALSAPSESTRFARGIRYIEELGFKVKVVLDPSSQYGKKDFLFSSDSAENRAKGLTELFCDPEVKAIIAVRGAYGSEEILPKLDLSLIAQHPKPLCGFSDTTALLVALARVGIVSVHGASVEASFSKASENESHRKNAATLIDLLLGRAATPYVGERLSGSGDVEGVLVGGNLGLLSALIGTPWEIQTQDRILFFEEIGEKPYRVHRSLYQLKLAGKLESLRGVVIGHITDCLHAKGLGPTVEEVIADIFKEYRYPVLKGVPFGHEEINLPMPLGVSARIISNKLEFSEPTVLL